MAITLNNNTNILAIDNLNLEFKFSHGKTYFSLVSKEGAKFRHVHTRLMLLYVSPGVGWVDAGDVKHILSEWQRNGFDITTLDMLYINAVQRPELEFDGPQNDIDVVVYDVTFDGKQDLHVVKHM